MDVDIVAERDEIICQRYVASMQVINKQNTTFLHSSKCRGFLFILSLSLMIIVAQG